MDKKKQQLFLAIFAVIALAVILIGMFVLKVPVVPMGALIVLEVILAVIMHKAELWFHGLVVLVQIITGILIKKLVLIALCVAIYVLAIYVLKILSQEKNANGR